MEKNCKTCGYCKFLGTETSPGGVMFITNYRCENPESTSHCRVMNSIAAHGNTLDSRENNSCEQWTDPSKASADIVERAEERQHDALSDLPEKVVLEVKEAIGKDQYGRKVSISDVDDSSKVSVEGVQSVALVEGGLIVNGTEYNVPTKVLNATPNCILQSNGDLYVNGYKYEDGTFRRTLFTWLKCVFS